MNSRNQPADIRPGREPRRYLRLASAAALALATAGLAACSVNSPNNSGTTTSTGGSTTSGSLTVWVDSNRLPGVELYEKTHPKVHINLVTYDGDANGANTLQTKMELYNQVGSGWPDVVFTEENTDIASLADSSIHYAADLDGLVPSSVINNFAKGSLADCTVDGKLYCLRNDVAQDVLWYNATLMKKFGYSVPTTWQQWQALGEKVAKQHPGYIIGTSGDSYDEDVYFWGNQCPMNDVTSSNTVTIDPSSPKCTEMANLLDPLIKDGTVPPIAVASSSFVKEYGGKVLMLVGPSWYGQYIFGASTSLNVPAGEIAAADPLTWAGSAPSTGDVGGGLWIVSSHAKDPALAASFAEWMDTSDTYQATAPTYPAYVPAAEAWLAANAKSHYFTDNLAPVFTKAASEMWTGWSATRYSTDALWADTVVPALVAGHSLSSEVQPYATQLADYAQTQQYKVVGG